MKKPKKVLLLGSGALKIGQAGEFDFSGSQCIKALKEEGIKTVLINPNIATYQTSEGLADKIYLLPITPYFVEKVIEKEKPDGILLSFGGQTALNCGVELEKIGVLKKHNVAVLGTPVAAIEKTEDRELFVHTLDEIGVKTPRSKAVASVKDGLQAAERIGYPVMVRAAYALGGLGSGVAYDKKQLEQIVEKALGNSPQALIEEYLKHWKEIEYEVVRDAYDNCITVCNMENVDPLGIHTGESIVVAPSQTLTNNEYHKLREISIKVIRHLGIVGECNIQFGLNPKSEEYRVIEVNARLSRSSALASKATGYPLAFIAAKLALGYALYDIQNKVTQKTTACFEPALDYIVIKIPRWDLNKFRNVSRRIGSEMKSVGEVMAIGRTFEEVLQKAIRMLQVGMVGLVGNNLIFRDVEAAVSNPTDRRLFAIARALKEKVDVDQIHAWSGIDRWFLHKMKNIVEVGEQIRSMRNLSTEMLLRAKQMGFSDHQLGKLIGKKELDVRGMRKKANILPSVKQIDTLAAEYPARTNYLYMTYNSQEHDISPSKRTQNEKKQKSKHKSVMVLGSGAYRIGSSVEFDWCCVHAVQAAKRLGYKTIMVNYNPETVSTDYDECDSLYFEELSVERVLDIYEFEQPRGIIVSMGGQIPNNIALKLHNTKVRILGTSPVSIDIAENRHKFAALLDTLGIDQPEWKEVTTLDDAKAFAARVRYPVLVRPSYVLSGAAMNVTFNDEDLVKYITQATAVSPEYPVVITKFLENAKEIEIDAVAQEGRIIVHAISEHVENAGVHSGDATMVLPPQKTYLETVRKARQIAHGLAHALNITGPFNIQFLAKENDVKVIECNLRASRSFPFVSKVFKMSFIDLATRALLGKRVPRMNRSALALEYVGVKAPQFSFSRLKGTDPVPSVEMASTGEVACFGEDLHEAFLKALVATGHALPNTSVLLSIGGEKNRYELLDAVKKLQQRKCTIYATEHTAEFYAKHGIATTRIYKIHEKKKPNVYDFLVQRKLDLIISVPKTFSSVEKSDSAIIRRSAVEFNIPLLNNVQLIKLFAESLERKKEHELEIKAWDEY